MKKALLILSVLCITFSVSAQINPPKNLDLKDKPNIYTPSNLGKADPLVLEIISDADDGSFKITMTSLTVTKYADTGSRYIGSRSNITSSSTDKLFSLIKMDALTAEGSFFVNESTKAANVKIYTTNLGGRKMTIRHTEGAYTGLINIKNIKITKKGTARYVLTGESERNGNITTYVFNIYRYVTR